MKVQPFRALRYAAGLDLARVTTPPHDVITPAQKAQARSEAASIVHLILPEEGGEEGRFAVAAARLAQWQRDGLLVRDGAPAFYRYEATYGPPELRRTATALVAQVGLDPSHGDVKPHERTLPRKKGDRLRLRTATRCDLEPIWLLYKDPQGALQGALGGGEALSRFTDGDGVEHRLWRIADPLVMQDVQAWFAKRHAVIADGHHRYQSALEHHAATGRAEDAVILACLTRDNDPGLRIEATHRLVRWERDVAEALAAARTQWDVHPLPAPTADTRAGARPWARAARELEQGLEGAGTCAVVGRSGRGLAAWGLWLEGRHSSTDIAVSLVQTRLLGDCWGLSEGSGIPIAYERDTEECLRQVAAGEADLAILLPPERVETVVDWALAGRLMPAKATYFVPKPASGVVLGPLD